MVTNILGVTIVGSFSPCPPSQWVVAAGGSQGEGQVGSGPASLQYSLSCELVGPHRDAVDELHGTPQPVELHALVHMHDAVGGWWAPPDGVLQVASNAGQDDLEHGQATAQPLLGQQVTFPSNGNLLGTEVYVKIQDPICHFPNTGAGSTWNSFTRTDVLPRAKCNNRQACSELYLW